MNKRKPTTAAAVICTTSLALCVSLAWAGPTFLVEPYLQNPGPYTMTVAWETTDGDNRLEYWQEGLPHQIVPAARVSARDIWYATLTGLDPDMTYHYRVLTEAGAGEIYKFHTWPLLDSPERTAKFVVFSDSQGDWPERLEDICENGIVAKECLGGLAENCSADIAAVLVTGDLVRNGGEVSQWRDEFFGRCSDLFHYVPILPAIGNHDSPIDNYLAYFILPENGSPGRLEQWYYTDLLNLRLITLNSATFDLGQWHWFDATLVDACSNPTIEYVVTQFHHACKSEVWPPGENIQSCIFVSRLENVTRDCNKPSAHLFGHTHAYSRGQSRDVSHLWVNVAVSAGDIDYWGEEPPRDYNEFEVSYDEYGYSVFQVKAGPASSLSMVRRTGGDDTTYYGYSDESIRDGFAFVSDNSVPDAPEPIYPVDIEVQGQTVTLQASPYADPDGDRHLEAHWQVTTVPGDYSSPLVNAWGNKTRARNIFQDIDTQAGIDITTYTVYLPLNQTYYWRVRYRDEHLGWSQWSEESSFSTVPHPAWQPASTATLGASNAGQYQDLGMLAVCAAPVAVILIWKRKRAHSRNNVH